ncbi:hypothetical protein BASA60_003198 [Batrachochytrium salamandrivorans]|nr:hypothetical protein BASA62_010163 [Batrachochytrium salamandrivorans]KAH6579698.1 hypothetical protein BASA60_003198 [Batrachochytrium salamandrivorans]KAH9275832.1 hypothetical protein BASA83_001635 [Batrachochytrium salamandrivorans]
MNPLCHRYTYNVACVVPKRVVRFITTNFTAAESNVDVTAASTSAPRPATEFRKEFQYSRPIFWYPSHQTKALKQLKDGIHHIDLVVEVRDARIPLTSINHQFDHFLANRERIVVYNKADLANANMRKPLTDALRQYRNEDAVFTCANNGLHVKKILSKAIEKCRNNPERYPYLSMIIVGIPNVGKSSLINSLRRLGVKKGKVTAVGKIAGVTTAIQTRVKIFDDPPIYLVDTPGIYDPHVSSPMEGLKISLTGGTRDRLTEELHVADYLLFRLNTSANIKKYPAALGLEHPTDQIYDVLRHICRKNHFLLDKRGRLFDLTVSKELPSTDKHMPLASSTVDPGSIPDSHLDIDRAARYMLDKYREGMFGPMTLDDCSLDHLKETLTGWRPGSEHDAELES